MGNINLEIKNEIVHIYIDGANLYERTKENKTPINFNNLYKYLKIKQKANEIYYFVGYEKKNQDIYDLLIKIGFKIIFRESSGRGEYFKGNCDSEMVLTICRDLFKNNIDKYILMTSDGDFSCVVRELQDNNKECILISPTFVNKTSKLLRKVAKRLIYLEQIYHFLK